MDIINEAVRNLCIKINFHSRKKRNRIVLIRLDALGDFILWLDSAKEFKQKYPRVKVTVICQKAYAGFARTLPYFDEVYGIDINKMQRSLIYFFAVLVKVNCYRGAVLVQTVYSRTRMMDVIVSMIPARKKITAEGDDQNYSEGDVRCGGIYDDIKHFSSVPQFELRKNSMFMNHLGFRGFRSSLPALPHYPLGKNRIGKDYFVIVLGTSVFGKGWKPEYYGIVARYIQENYKLQCCLLGTGQDKHLVEEFSKTYGPQKDLVNLLGETEISEYIQLIREARLVISGDTSAAHIAAAVRTKSVVITGGWHYGRFFPYNTETGEDREYFPRICYQYMPCYQCNRKRIAIQCRKDERNAGCWSCILAVTPQKVIREVDTALQEDTTAREWTEGLTYE